MSNTNQSKGRIGPYLGALPTLPLLTPDEEKSLGRVAQGKGPGAKDARTRLVLHNTRLVVSQALKYSGRNAVTQAEKDENLINLTGEGMFGLMEAAARFDPARGCRFSTYATYWIRRYVFKALNQGRMIRIPYYMHGILAKIPWAWSVLTAEKPSEDVTDADMCEKLKCTLSEYQRTLDISSSTQVYLPNGDIQQGGDEYTEQRDVFDAFDYRYSDPGDEAETKESEDLLWVALGQMEPKLAHLLMLRHGFGAKKRYTLTEIGDILNLSRERIRQLEREALDEFTVRFNKAKSVRDLQG